jgi:cytochrome P450
LLQDLRNQIQDIIDDKNQGYKDASHPTIFKELLDSDLPSEEKSIDRLEKEGVTIVSAGQATVKDALTIAMFHLLKSPSKLKKLRDAIHTVFPETSEAPSLTDLENLPYLTATVQEGTFRNPYR